VLIRRAGRPGNGPVTQLVRRLSGVLVARRYVMLAYDVRADNLDAAVALTPASSRRRSPAAPGGLGRRAGHGAARRGARIMDELYEVGARAILVTDIHACRL
jgi:ATP phosphoribosyltransferase